MVEQFVRAAGTADDRNIRFSNHVGKIYGGFTVISVTGNLVQCEQPFETTHHLIRLRVLELVRVCALMQANVYQVHIFAEPCISNVLRKREVFRFGRFLIE